MNFRGTLDETQLQHLHNILELSTINEPYIIWKSFKKINSNEFNPPYIMPAHHL